MDERLREPSQATFAFLVCFRGERGWPMHRILRLGGRFAAWFDMSPLAGTPSVMDVNLLKTTTETYRHEQEKLAGRRTLGPDPKPFDNLAH